MHLVQITTRTTIIEKLDIYEKIIERLDGLANLFTSKIDGLTNIIKNHSGNAGKLSEKMTKELTLTRTEMVEELKKIITVQEKQTFKSQTWRENNDLKRKIESWRNNFNERKFTYWKSLKNLKLSEVYMRWTEEKPPTILAKFLPTPITNELESQYQRRLRLSVEKKKP